MSGDDLTTAAELLIDRAWQARRDGRHGEKERDLLRALAECRGDGSRVDRIRALTALAQ